MRPRSLPLLALVPVITACYAYRPVTAPAPASTVVIDLTEFGTLSLARVIGPKVGTILGEVSTVRGDTLDLAIVELASLDGETFKLSGATVSVTPPQVARMRTRAIEPSRTVATAAALVMAATAVYVRVRSGGRR